MAVTLAIKLDEETRRRLHALGELRHRTPHWLMRAAILEFLAREEAYEREKAEDAARWEQYVFTGDAVGHEAVADWLDSIGTDHERPCPR